MGEGNPHNDKVPSVRTVRFVAWQAVACLGLLLGSARAFPADALHSSWLARSWQTDEGLPDNNVSGVTQTPDGYVWVATFGGLLRFNGARFEEFSTVHLEAVPNRVIRAMHQDRQGRLWLAMDQGPLLCADAKTVAVFTQNQGLPRARVSAMAEDNLDRLWVAYGSRLYTISGGKVTPVDAVEGLPSSGNWWLASATEGGLWCARSNQLALFSRGAWQHVREFEQPVSQVGSCRQGGAWVCAGAQVFKLNGAGELGQQTQLPDTFRVRILFEDRTGALWIGTAADGLWRWSQGVREPVSTSHSEINCLSEDREGNIWAGTGGGLDCLRPRALDLFGKEAGLPFEFVSSVCQDTEGWLWVVTQNGLLARGRAEEWHPLTAAEGWPGGNVSCVLADAKDGVWIGTRDRGLQQLRQGTFREWRRRDGLGSESVRSLLQARNGDLWVATDSPSRLRRLRDGRFRTLGMPGEVRYLRALAEGADGTIWAGTSDGQLLRAEGDRLVNETVYPEERAVSIRTLHTTPDGSLWIGYAGWGVGRLRAGRYSRITSAQGLFDDYVSQIVSDDRGGLWMTGNHGLFQVRLEELLGVAEGRANHVRSIVYGRSEGLPSLQPACENSPVTSRAADGDLWFATHNGLLRVRPADIRDNPAPPPVLLERVTVDDQVIARFDSHAPLTPPAQAGALDLRTRDTPLRLPPGHRKLEFEFTALSYSSPENVHFRHRLEDFDPGWVESGAQRTARYPRLPAGEYEFRVIGCNDAGVWNEAGVTLGFTVLPFFWQTWWFRLSVLGTFTAGVVGLVRFFSFRRLRRRLARLEHEESLHRERARIARDMHDEVGAKLSRLSLLSDMASHQSEMPSSTRREVTDISETARDAIRSFDQIVWAVNPRNDSLVDLMHYVCRFAEEFFEGSAVQCAFDLPETIPALVLPTEARHQIFLAVKEALNNVLKHSGAALVRIHFRLENGRLAIGIEDDGQGFSHGESPTRVGSGNGLRNMRERMQVVGGELALSPGAGTGTRVTFRVPCGETNVT